MATIPFTVCKDLCGDGHAHDNIGILDGIKKDVAYDEDVVKYNDSLNLINAHGGWKRVYNGHTDDWFYALDKRANVTGVRVIGGKEYSLSASEIEKLFDGKETFVTIGENTHVVITIEFPNEVSYIYGQVFMTFYYKGFPRSASMRVYSRQHDSNYTWTDSMPMKLCKGDGETQSTYLCTIAERTFNAKKLEFTVYGANATKIAYLEMFHRRASVGELAVMTKTVPQTLVYPLTAPEFVGNLTGTAEKAAMDANGDVIHETYAKVEALNRDINAKYANALKGIASGEVVKITDVSPAEHTIAVKVGSKNLIPYPYKGGNTYGVTITDNGDGSLTLNGTAERAFNYYLSNDTAPFTLENGFYTLSGGYNKDGAVVNVLARKNGSSWLDAYNTPKTGEVVDGDIINYISLYISSGSTFDNVTVYPQFERGTVATEHTKYVPDVSQAKLIKQGKNLLDIDSMLNDVLTKNGEEYTFAKITDTGWSGRSSKSLGVFIPANTPITLSAGTITFNGILSDALAAQFTFDDGSKENIVIAKNKLSRTQTYTKSIVSLAFYINTGEAAGTPISIFTKPQLEVGTAATEYEPYVEPTEYAISADCTVEGVNSLYPTTTLVSDTTGVKIEAEYNRDINKAFAELQQAIISLGGNV